VTARRLVDLAVSAAGLVLLSPLLVVVAIAIRLGSRGPVLYRTERVGLHGELFTMHKFRTMYVDQGPDPERLTRPADPRITLLGAWLRRLKVDEFPQLWDVLRGKMSLVGPRPEDPYYVRVHFTPGDLETLRVPPGLTSPATLYDYTHGDEVLAGGDTERRYVERLLPARMALETIYLRDAGFLYDLRILLRTAAVMAWVALGRRRFPEPREMREVREVRARGLAERARGSATHTESASSVGESSPVNSISRRAAEPQR